MGIAAAGTFAIAGDTVHRLGFGAMRLCGPMVWGYEDRDNAGIVLRRALELGVDFIDTADAYGPEVNEYQIRDALAPYPAGLLVATKGGLHRGPPGLAHRRPAVHLRRAILNSKRRLGLDVIDLYELPPPATPSPAGLGPRPGRGPRRGYINVGLSNVTVDQWRRPRHRPHRHRPEPLQPGVDGRRRRGRRLRAPTSASSGTWPPPSVPPRRGVLAEIAAAHSATPSQVALAWLLAKGVMLPIPGTSKVAHLEERRRCRPRAERLRHGRPRRHGA